MKIAMIASEANPFCKSGGLADVAYSLTRELCNANNEAIIILPFYKSIKDKNINAQFLGYDYVKMSWRNQYIGIFKKIVDKITYYFVDNEYYFLREQMYGYSDDHERFAFFSLAALKILKFVSFKPDIIHVHDWQAGMIPCLLKKRFNSDPFYFNVHSVLTIHNPAFKGFMDRFFLNDLYGLSDELYDNGSVRFANQVSTLKAAITYADEISTVSPTHRNELLQDDLSHGLCGVLSLRADDFVGIINGLDTNEFNPSNDKYIINNYTSSLRSFSLSKRKNKMDVLKSFSLPLSDGPLYGLVSRLTWQKGIDLIIQNIHYLVSKGASIIILGSGEKELENTFQQLQKTYPNQVGIYIGYNNELAHKVYAGSDFFLMPSLFEPCGIGQIIAQRYGTLPIVRETGGLSDTVIGYHYNNEQEANGFSFKDYNGIALGYALNKSLEIYDDKAKMKTMIVNAMQLDRSWTKSMNEYLNLYRKAIKK